MASTIVSMRVLSATAALLSLFGTPALAQVEIPCDTVRVVVPYGAGGGSDAHARIIVDRFNQLHPEPQLQVVNITGQGGNTGAREVHNADPDGCTLFFQHEAILASYLTGRADFSWDGFTPVAMATVEPSIFAASPNAPFDNLTEMIAYAKEHPGETLVAASLGSNTHFFLLVMQEELGVEFNVIGYEGGRERVTALLGNTVQMGQVGESDALQYFSGGDLKALGYFSDERSANLPDVPTAKEQGVDLDISMARGFLLPPGASDELADDYAGLFEEAVKDPKVVAQLEDLGGRVRYMGPDEYAAWWGKQAQDWERIARSLGIYMAE